MKNITELRQASQRHKIAPSDRAWFVLENRLSSSKNKGEVKFYKSIAIAAIFLAILGIVGMFQWKYFQNIEPSINMQYSLQSLENKDNDPQDIYEMSKLWQLKQAYNKQGTKTKI